MNNHQENIRINPDDKNNLNTTIINEAHRPRRTEAVEKGGSLKIIDIDEQSISLQLADDSVKVNK